MAFLDGQIFYAGGVFISFFLFLLLLGKQRKTAADRWLTFWLFFGMLHLAMIGWYAAGNTKAMPQLIGWEMPLPFLHGPFLYLYILFLTRQQKPRARHYLHFLPALLCALSLIPILFSLSPQEKLDQEHWAPFRLYFDLLTIAIIISGITYISLSLVLLRRHKQNINQQFSYTEKISLNWLRYLIGGMGIIWSIVIFYRIPQGLYLSVALFIFFMGYFGIRQAGIFVERPDPGIQPLATPLPGREEPLPAIPNNDGAITEPGQYLPELQPVPETEYTPPVTTSPPEPETQLQPVADEQTGPAKVKYERTGLTETDALDIQRSMKLLMQEQQPYKDPELTLGDLAKALDVHPAILSQVINTKEQQNFHDYINTLRVGAFKELVLQTESRQYTLLSLAFECGFNSKSSFNRNFKKATGLSPSAYVKQQGVAFDQQENRTAEE